MGFATMTFDELLGKLNNISPQLVEEDKQLVLPNGLGFHVSTEVLTPHGDADRFIQAVLRVTYNGVYVTSWGCEDAKTSYKLAWWYKSTKQQVQSNEFEKESVARKEGLKLYKQL